MFPSSVAIGIMAEIIVLTMLLTQRYNVLQKEKNQLLQQQLAMQKELGDRIAETQENEQKRIAEDLHDGIGSMLTALRMMINKGIHHFTAKGLPEAAEILLPIQQQLDKVVVDIRTISHNLMPKDFEQSEFDSIIRDHLSVINAVSEVNVEYYLDPLINQLPKGLQISLFRIFTELLNNSLKHSQTQHITAQFIIHPHILMLMIEDEGIGFAMDKANDGIGLKNIRSRVRFLSGKISFDSSPKGTIIIVEIPLT
jgi:signal transduction histidine kinase